MEELKTYQIKIKGIVQGIGFRPFIYNLANKFNIKGFVLNDSNGVLIIARQNKKQSENFIKQLKTDKPDLAFYKSFKVSEIVIKDKINDFVIKKSIKSDNTNLSIPSDIALCESCSQELFDETNRRFFYPFTGCTNCGPRFTITDDMPYDRETTSLKEFKMCRNCEKEYHDPSDRRFHSQNNICFTCGPLLRLTDNKDKVLIKGIDKSSTAEIFKLLAEFPP